ncbi:hypothetical protein CHS0354_011220 [Potamilus streckersoni]|uniref:Uncharacterized protein n=1 Tax=Potamilus streckersoni TaxID=2493646 RepID=A0AAE0RNA7_9BIVA|nr:hypothetical protein CHS0354_011220 [Potamilus streckersoni]
MTSHHDLKWSYFTPQAQAVVVEAVVVTANGDICKAEGCSVGGSLLLLFLIKKCLHFLSGPFCLLKSSNVSNDGDRGEIGTDRKVLRIRYEITQPQDATNDGDRGENSASNKSLPKKKGKNTRYSSSSSRFSRAITPSTERANTFHPNIKSSLQRLA